MSNLNAKQLTAAFHIAIGESKKKAAELCNITPQTISEWLKQPAFEAKINEYQMQLLNEAQRKFKNLANDAVVALEEILNNAESEKSKLDAAKYVLDKLQIIQDHCPAILTIGETTEEGVIYKRKIDAAKKQQDRIFMESSLMALGNSLDYNKEISTFK